MKEGKTPLIQLGCFAILFIFYGGIWWLFHLKGTLSTLITLAVLATFSAAFFYWILTTQKKKNEIIDEFQHPFFGTLKQKRHSWETSLSIPHFGSNILISSYDGSQPTKNQEKTIDWLSESILSIREELEKCLDNFDREANSLPPRPRHLVFQSLLLDANDSKSFTLAFDIRGCDLPWGFSACYVDGELDEFTDDH